MQDFTDHYGYVCEPCFLCPSARTDKTFCPGVMNLVINWETVPNIYFNERHNKEE
jgi:hypothetical protein